MGFQYHPSLKHKLNTMPYYWDTDSGEYVYRFYFPELGKSYPIRERKVSDYVKYLREETKKGG